VLFFSVRTGSWSKTGSNGLGYRQPINGLIADVCSIDRDLRSLPGQEARISGFVAGVFSGIVFDHRIAVGFLSIGHTAGVIGRPFFPSGVVLIVVIPSPCFPPSLTIAYCRGDRLGKGGGDTDRRHPSTVFSAKPDHRLLPG
jgi:hypothetical protein